MISWEDVKEKLILVEGWARDGATLDEISSNLGMCRQTLYVYIKKYPELKKAIKNGKEVIDYAVENALLKKALSGDTTAQIFWLKNRKSAQWRDNRNIDIGNKDGESFKTEQTLTAEQQALLELVAKRVGEIE